MNHKLLRNLALSLCLLAPAAHAAEPEVCNRLDMESDELSVALPDLRIFNGALVIRDEDDAELLVITEEGVMRYHGEEMALSPHNRALALAYYENAQLAATEFARLGMSAAGVGLSAVGEAFAMLFTGKFDERAFEKKVEGKAKELEARANAGCAYLEDIKRIESELAASLPGFEPVMFRQPGAL